MPRAVYIDEHDACVLIKPVPERSWAPPVSQDVALERVRERAQLDFSDALCRAGFGRGHLLDVVLYTRAFSQADAATVREAAAELVQGLLGGRIFDNWIDSVDASMLSRVSSLPVVDQRSPQLSSFPLSELNAAVAAGIDSVVSGLPDRLLLESLEQSTWTMFELEPESATDYASQDDLVLATTLLPEMLKCYLRGAPFYSGRFSRRGEIFCYLKFEDQMAHPAEQRLERRRALEDSLNEALLPEAAGAVIGNGLGSRYSYVDFALVDVPRGVDLIRRVAHELELPERSWILFCDSSLSAEWIGVYDDQLRPPLLA